MKCFWDFSDEILSNVALVTEEGELVTYEKLDEEISLFSKLSFDREVKKLVFLKVSNTYQSVVRYLACLRSGYPFLILDEKISDELLSDLEMVYSPNLVITDTTVKNHSEYRHKFCNQLTMLMSTSGTTGTPKLVRLSKKNLISNTNSIVEYLNIVESDKAITSLPFSYSYGLSVINSHLAVGSTIVLSNASLVSRDFWQKVKEYSVTSFSGVPYTFEILKKLKYSRFDTSSIRYVTQAGGKLDEETIEYFVEECNKLKQKFVVMYGQTEASPRISYVPHISSLNKLGSIGIPIPNGKLELVDQAGELIDTAKTIGELKYTGENVMLGYAEHPDDFSLGDVNSGVLYTGDLGYFDEDKFFYICGRIKRFIKLFGLRISLDEIEDYLLKYDFKVLVTGSDDVLSVYFERSESYSKDYIKSLISDTYKININVIEASEVEFFPRLPNGKINYKLLSEGFF